VSTTPEEITNAETHLDEAANELLTLLEKFESASRPSLSERLLSTLLQRPHLPSPEVSELVLLREQIIDVRQELELLTVRLQLEPEATA
jgi:hypothetical protein